jgi:hypothetical protein
MRVLRWLLGAVLLLVLAVAALAVGARFADGPVALLPGGALRSGEWAPDGAVDWSFAPEIPEIELESDGRSRTTWILVEGAEAYIFRAASTSRPGSAGTTRPSSVPTPSSASRGAAIGRASCAPTTRRCGAASSPPCSASTREECPPATRAASGSSTWSRRAARAAECPSA